MGKTFDRLIKRVRDRLGVELKPPLRRLYPGRHQRAAAHWVWEDDRNIGSCESATALLRAEKLVLFRGDGGPEIMSESR